MKEKLKLAVDDFFNLMRTIPSITVALFVLATVLMNFGANKEIDLKFLVTDCGIIFSWLVFLTMDVVTKHFGPKAAVKLAIFGTACNLIAAGLFFFISKIPSNWAMYYELGDTANIALDSTFGGTWYVLLGSTIAYIVSAIVNAFVNWGIGKTFSSDNFKTFAIRSWISTSIGQFTDNLVFALIVSLNFFGWSIKQCFVAAFTTAIVELVCEVIFSPFGYRISKNWKELEIGKDYITHQETL